MSVSCFSFWDSVGVPGRKSSLGENYAKTGCIRSAGIIPARKLCQNRMHSAGENHPWEKILLKQDEFGQRKSSLGESFVKTGCIWPAEIIPGRKFRQNRMHSAGGNHPCEKVLSKQDAFGRRKSSLRENSIKSGCIRSAEIIPGRKFRQIRMNSDGGKAWNCGNAKKTQAAWSCGNPLTF